MEAVIAISAMLAAMATVATTVAAWLALLRYSEQATAQKQAAEMAAVAEVFRVLQDEEVRRARRTVADLSRSKAPVDEWTDAQIWAAERVCSTYDMVAMLAKGAYFPVESLRPWKSSITMTFTTTKPLIDRYRGERDNDYWATFEWLYIRASAWP